MSIEPILQELESLGDAKMRMHHLKHGATGIIFGVKMGDIRKLAARLGIDHDRAINLWESGVMDARLLAILTADPKRMSAADLEHWVGTGDVDQVADWLQSYLVKGHPDKEMLRQAWMSETNPWLLRSAWALTAGRIASNPEGLDINALLDLIDREFATVHKVTQWTMNTALAYIGIHHPSLRTRAIAIAEHWGIYRDYPVSKGCTSPFAPIWIAEMVRRKHLTDK